MRAIDLKLANHLVAFKPVKSGESKVVVEGDKSQLYLYGSKIAELEAGDLKISWANKPTATTTARIKGVLSVFTNDRVQAKIKGGLPVIINTEGETLEVDTSNFHTISKDGYKFDVIVNND